MNKQHSQDTQEFLSEDEAAQLLGLNARTLQGWRFQRRVLPFVKLGRCVRYRRADILAHLEKNTVTVDA